MTYNQINKNLMKAISRLLIMLTLCLSITGFGLTTTDLSQNSKPGITQCINAKDISAAVVTIHIYDSKIKETESIFSSETTDDNSYGVIGSEFYNRFKTTLKKPKTLNINRFARDGLSC